LRRYYIEGTYTACCEISQRFDLREFPFDTQDLNIKVRLKTAAQSDGDACLKLVPLKPTRAEEGGEETQGRARSNTTQRARFDSLLNGEEEDSGDDDFFGEGGTLLHVETTERFDGEGEGGADGDGRLNGRMCELPEYVQAKRAQEGTRMPNKEVCRGRSGLPGWGGGGASEASKRARRRSSFAGGRASEETFQTPPAAGEVAHALGRTRAR
jgi:hypothetical protein